MIAIRCALVAVLLLMASHAQAAADMSEYRTATYGSPTHYCDPTRSLSDNGTGTLVNAWNLTQCASQPVAGNVVGMLPGQSVALAAPGSRLTPAFRPTNSGSWSGSACTSTITYVTKYPAISLDYDTITSNANRTELRHAGTDDVGVSEGSGGSVYGAPSGINCITFDGIFVDMAQNGFHLDSGIIAAWSASGITFKNFVIKGKDTNADTNATLIRTDAATTITFDNYYIAGHHNTGSQVGETSIHYGSQNIVHRHFHLKNVDRGLFLKGTTTGPVFNYGTFQYGIIEDVSSCIAFNDLHATELTLVQYVLCKPEPVLAAVGNGGIIFDSISTAARNVTIDHVTVAKLDATSINTGAALEVQDLGLGSGVTFTNNLFDNNSGTYGHQVLLLSQLPATMNYNGYYKNGSTESYVFNGTQYNSFASWQGAISSRDANSVELSSTPFNDRAGNDFTINTGHAAYTASSTGAQLGAYGGSEVLGPDTSAATTSTSSVSTSGGVTLSRGVELR